MITQEQLFIPIAEYIPAYHMYLINGIVVPSVTQVVSWVVHKDYSDVPAKVLEAKADYGNRVHHWVETYCLENLELAQTNTVKLSTDQFKELAERECIDIESVEQIVTYSNKYAGTYDMYGWKGNERALFDIKTTAVYDAEYLEWQLGMYKMALESIGHDVDKCYCIWMPKGKRVQLLEVKPRGAFEVLDALDKYNESLLEDLPF